MSPARAPLSVLVVDDELRSLETLKRTLDEYFTVFTANSADEGMTVMHNELVQIVVSDQRMPGTSGVAFLRAVRDRWPDTVRLILSGYTEAEDIITGINEAGIWQYLLKPWHPDQLLLTLQSAGELWRLQQENQRLTLELRTHPDSLALRVAGLRQQARALAGFDKLLRTPDSPLNAVCTLAQRIAGHDLSVLITGESGTGKELLARAIHYASARAEQPFVVENCGAMPDTLLESELFGHKRGAFTGATDSHIGLFQQADGGTLFLDEIGETSPAFQVKLLRALQEGEIRPVGSARPVAVDVRLIAATNRNLELDVASGRFREDLYYRVAGITLYLPALRERARDIPLLVSDLLKRSPLIGRSLSSEALDLLNRHSWPGNVRELQNEIRRAMAISDGAVLGPELLSPRIQHAAQTLAVESAANEVADEAIADTSGQLKHHLERFEAQIVKESMLRHKGNKTHVAEELGLTRVGLRMKLMRLGLNH
ncbi:sigma-54 dependent transcriptional regulator [Rhodoferax sp.]|uniref:sigma-54-dependent transcriptional regulator n=1 Tax=Rhodoferax sp. TaxID=50421 RepID=UPI00260DEEF7|nr:sigma-54 dependent transcriptional regulator [Rhodoferax sp.]MDD2919339.1 sigma-54 dependent transcriptional regulator [Rhodoferax sp.]